MIGGLHYYARGTRYDIPYAVSRVSQTLVNPNRGTVRALEQITGYLRRTHDFCLRGRANPEVDNIIGMCDTSHRVDRLINNRSQT